ncbi:putative secreted protein [Xanthomonas citri pv. fuscans]|nr:putative secreted protein [Xanthomonas citri pv. fuscans]
MQAQFPDASWNDMAQFAFARELVVRPGGDYPKYGAVERDYYGNEYDGFQDTFTSSLYANLEWGRFAQAAAVLDNYFDAFVQDDGLPNMRGPEVGQLGLTLSLLARYLRYTGDAPRLRRVLPKIAATAQVLCALHDQALALPRTAHGHGLLHGWNESDACLFPDPSLWWKPYYANSALTIRGWEDIAQVWSTLGGDAGQATQWQRRAKQLRARLEASLRANVRRDLTPPYVGPLPGTTLTFRQSLLQEKPSEQQWPHRAYAELLQADVLPHDLAHLVIDCLRGHGGTSIGVVANIAPPEPGSRDLLGFISYGYAQQLLRLDRIEEYLLFVYAHRYQVHTRGSWTAGEVSGITGGMPLFCIPAQMTIPLLLRWMLVSDDSAGEQLFLARAVPRAWLGSGAPVGISAAPTRWGAVTLTLRTDTVARCINADVQLPERAPARTWLTLRAPAGTRLQRVLVDGKPAKAQGPHADRVALPGAAARVKVQAWYA